MHHFHPLILKRPFSTTLDCSSNWPLGDPRRCNNPAVSVRTLCLTRKRSTFWCGRAKSLFISSNYSTRLDSPSSRWSRMDSRSGRSSSPTNDRTTRRALHANFIPNLLVRISPGRRAARRRFTSSCFLFPFLLILLIVFTHQKSLQIIVAALPRVAAITVSDATICNSSLASSR